MSDNYFDISQSVSISCGDDDRYVLNTIANHFIGNHPDVPYQYKMDFDNGILCDKKGRYQFDFEQRFPEANVGDICAARGRIWSFHERSSNFNISCIGPTVCLVNGEQVFNSIPGNEGRRAVNSFQVSLVKGWNDFLFTTEKTVLGFGFECGNAMAQWEPYLFQSPHEKREGQVGFVYSKPFTKLHSLDYKDVINRDLIWLPEQYEDVEKELISWENVFSNDWNGISFAKAKIAMEQEGSFSINGNYTYIYLDGKKIESSEIKLSKGEHTLIVCFEKTKFEPAGECEVVIEGGCLVQDTRIQGYHGIWIYLGTFHNNLPSVAELLRMDCVYYDGEECRYWKTSVPHGGVRICVESELYGRWTYPMGVTLYGLLKTADYLNRPDYEMYIRKNVEQITRHQSYALFDQERFGFPSLNQQICWLTELDDCGSFGSLMLECDKRWKNDNGRKMAEVIADHMRNKQHRMPDGAFCRKNDTMWIDDLYMSVPFLVRYYGLSKDIWYLDEACRQILLFQKYFYMEDKKLMSHIYDTRWEKANRIPWSRGNGWVIFSLSELLNVLPENHEKRELLISFYQEMAEGLLRVQGEHGLWHQVLDDESTYEESSSTAMFICAFSRGVIGGYVGDNLNQRLSNSVKIAWKGIKERAVDCHGNLYGVCQGSGCSFSRDYYRNLLWRFNDAHGIGIVLMAGVEACMLKEWEINQD